MKDNNAIIIGLFYPHGKDWDLFIHRSIQHWEHFYIQWISNPTKILVVYFDDLASERTENTLKSAITFLNLKINEDRLNCVLQHNEDTYRKQSDFLNKNILYANTTNFRATNSCILNEIYSFNMYTNTHVVWINSAIRRVKHELQKRGFEASRLSNYENTNLQINICPGI